MRQEWLKQVLFSREISCRWTILKEIFLKLEINSDIWMFFSIKHESSYLFLIPYKKEIQTLLKSEHRLTEPFRVKCWTGKEKHQCWRIWNIGQCTTGQGSKVVWPCSEPVPVWMGPCSSPLGCTWQSWKTTGSYYFLVFWQHVCPTWEEVNWGQGLHSIPIRNGQ